ELDGCFVFRQVKGRPGVDGVAVQQVEKYPRFRLLRVPQRLGRIARTEYGDGAEVRVDPLFEEEGALRLGSSGGVRTLLLDRRDRFVVRRPRRAGLAEALQGVPAHGHGRGER